MEVLELARYQNSQGDRFYHFDPFLADLGSDAGSTFESDKDILERFEPGQFDTIVVPAREDGFR